MKVGARHGFALLEVLCALAILALSGVALAENVSAAIRAERSAYAAERDALQLDQLLRVHALMNEDDMRLRIGTSRYGRFMVRVSERGRHLYEVRAISASAHGADTMATVMYFGE